MTDAMSNPPEFPPLLKGVPVAKDASPFAAAIEHAKNGGDPAHIFYADRPDVMLAAITLAPDMPLIDAMGGLFAVQLGLNDSLGALIPAEMPIHIIWPNGIKANGATCGHFTAAASTTDPSKEPDWLVIGLSLQVAPIAGNDPGLNPDQTSLVDEGCNELTVNELIESWSRHTLSWLHRFMDEGIKPLHEAWHGKCDDIGTDITHPKAGKFLGIDPKGGMLLQSGSKTDLIPLTDMLESTT